MPPRDRLVSPKLHRMRTQDAARRRVRTTSGRRPASRVPHGSTRRRGRRRSRRQKLAMTLAWSIVSAVFLTIGLVAESLVNLALAGAFALSAASAALLPSDSPGTDHPAPAVKPAQPPGSGSSRPRTRGSVPSGPVVLCTATRTPIDKCGCARRHVATDDGAKRYGRPIGSPLGVRKEPASG